MNQTVQECLSHLRNGKSLLVTFICFEGVFNSADGNVGIPRDIDNPTGAHAVIVTGWDLDKEAFIFVNGWGPDWGDQGHGWLPFYYFEKELIQEIYRTKY